MQTKKTSRRVHGVGLQGNEGHTDPEPRETQGNQNAIPAPMRNDIDLRAKPKKELRKGTLTKADVKGQPGDPREEVDPKEARIQYLRAKSDRTMEEGLELQELELGVRRSAEINAGYTSGKVHEDQKILRQNEREIREERQREPSQLDTLHA
jgi:hypothetical protein